MGAEGLRAEVVAQAAASEDEPLDTSTRLLLATVGATMVMLFMIGLGAVVLGLRDWRSQRRRAARVPLPSPDLLRPPGAR